MDTGLFDIIETQNPENSMMDHNGADMMVNELCDLNSYKDPLSPKCSPSGPLNEPWSPGSPSSSCLQERFHEESEEIDSAIEEVLCHITYVWAFQG